MSKTNKMKQMVQGETVNRKRMYKAKKQWVVAGATLIMGLGIFGGTSIANASEADGVWTAHTAEQIASRISEGQTSLTFQWGDTYWEIGKAINIEPFKLMEMNGLKQGDQYTIPVGHVVHWDGNHVTVKDAEGNVVSDVVVKDSDKMDSSKPVANQTTDTPKTPVQTDDKGNVVNTTTNEDGSKPTNTDSSKGTTTEDDSKGTSGKEDGNKGNTTDGSKDTDKGSTEDGDKGNNVENPTNPTTPEKPTDPAEPTDPTSPVDPTEPETPQAKEFTMTVVHEDEDGNVLLKESDVKVKEGETFKATAKSFDGFTLKGEATQEVKADSNKTITFIYTKNEAPTPTEKFDITIKYVDQDGKDLVDAETIQVEDGESYTATAKQIDGYTLDGEATQTITVDGNKTITFTYTKNVAPVEKFDITVKYVDEDGVDIADSDVTKDIEKGQVFTATAKEIKGYTVKGEATQTITVDGNKTITFTYVKDAEPITKYKVTVEHVADGEVLETEQAVEVEDGKTFTAQAKTFDGYTLKGDMSQTITVSKDTTITFTYEKDAVDVVNKDALETLVNAVKDLDMTPYTEDSAKAFTDALDSAKAVLADDSATQQQVDDATTALQNAYDSLEVKPVVVDKTALQEAISKANDLDSGKYTEDSFKDVVDALAKANEINDSTDATQEDVDLATQKLNEAISNLVEAPVTPETKTITVNYKTTEGKVIKTKTMTGEDGSSVTITPDAKVVDADGLGWKTSDKAQTVKYGEVSTVDFTYDKDMVSVAVQYKMGNTVLSSTTASGQLGSTKTITAPTDVVKDGLTYTISGASSATIKFGTDSVVSFEYVAKQATITVNHIFNDGKTTEKETVKAQVGSSQTFNAKTFDGYTLDGSATQTITVEGDATITFNYTKNAPVVDKTALQTLYNSVKDLTQGNYTDATWSTFETARANALNVLNDSKATQQQVDDAKTSLQNAYNGLKENVQKFAVTVVHKGSDGTTLETESAVQVEKGQKFTANAKTFDGYTLDGATSQTITVNANATITFNYTKDATSEPTIAEAEAKVTQDLFNAINNYRQENGLATLGQHDIAMQASATRAVEIFTVFDHVRPDGTLYSTALKELGFSGISGENIGMMTGSDLTTIMQTGYQNAIQAWKDSPDHNSYMLATGVKKMGIGVHIEQTNGYYKIGFVMIGISYDFNEPASANANSRSLNQETTESTVETEQSVQETTTETSEPTVSSGQEVQSTPEVSEPTVESTTEPTVEQTTDSTVESTTEPTTEQTTETTEQATETTASSEAVEVAPVNANIGNYNQLFATESEADAKGLAEATTEGGKWFGATYKVVNVAMTDGSTQYGLQFTAY